MNGEKMWTAWQYVKTVTITAAAGALIWYISDDTVLPFYAGLFLKVAGAFIILSGLLLAVLKDIRSRIYECCNCHKEFKPEMNSYRLFSRKQTCPLCGGEGICTGRDIERK